MTDNDIKKSLVCCLLGECMSCPIIRFQDCRIMLKDETISLLNRLQAEIKQAKSEAIKEFAERLESKYTKVDICNAGYVYETIKKVKKEMAGEQNA